jgi:hypothetical protein
MPIYTVEAPNGKSYELEAPAGVTAEQLSSALYAQVPEAATPVVKESGVLAQGKKGLEQLVSGLQTTGGAAFGDKNEAARAALARQAEFDRKYEQSPSLDRTTEAFKEKGFFSGLGQLASDAPEVLAAQIPQFGFSYAGGRLGAATGAKAGSAFGPRGKLAGALLGGISGAVGASYPSQLSGNIEAQAEEQVSKDKPIDINLPAAAGTAVPQAALDAVANLPFFGRGLFGKMLGIPKEVLERGSAEAVEKLAKESLAATVAKGTAVGFAAEFPTEVLQQVLQRNQAGQSLTSPEAYKQYGEIAYQTALLSPLGIAGRSLDKSGAKTQVQQKVMEQRREDDAAAAAAAPKPPDITDPAYLQQIQTQYQEAEQRKAALKSQLRKVEDGSVTETADRLHNKDIEEQIKAMTPELEQLATDYNKAAKVAPAFTSAAPVATGPEIVTPPEVKTPQAPKPAMTVGDALDNPLGRFNKDELSSRSPKIVDYIEEQRKKLGKPALNDYSIEDIRDAMPGELPDAEKADLNSLIAAKSGYTPEVTYKPEDIINVAKQKNIATDTDGFKFFLQRATGENNLTKMEQPQLHSAFTALSGLPEFDETQYLPEKTSATHYSPQQYNDAVQKVRGLTSEKDIPSSQALQVAKKATGLTRDSDVQLLLQNAYTSGDLNLSSKGDFITAQPAEQAEFKIEEGFAPAAPTGFNVMRGDQLLYSTQNEDEAKAKVESLSKVADPAMKQIDKSIASEQNTINASQRSLDIMEAGGMFRTPKYQQASAEHAALVEKVNENIQRLNEKKAYLQQPVTIQTTGKPLNVRTYKAKEKGVSEQVFNTREEALKHALENLPAARLNELAGKTKAPGFAKRLQAEIERRKAPPKQFVAAKPEPKVEAKVEPKEKPETTAQKEAVKSQILPMLKKFGLGDVALQIEEGMQAEGSYAASVIKVALDANNPVRVLRHESIHGLKDLGFFTPGQWKVLENQADKVWIDKYLKQRNINGQPIQAGQQSRFDAYKNLYDGDMDAIREEAIADAFGDFDVNGAPKGLFATLLQKMQDFFRALRSAFTGAGYETADDVFGKVERGELRGTKQAGAKEKPSLIRKAVEDEKEIATQNPQAKGRLYDPLTDMLSIDEAAVRESMEQNPELERNIIDAIKSYGFIPINTKDEDVIKVFKDNIVNNLLHLYKRVPKDVRERSKLWYDGANKIASELADRYDMTDTQVAGILAAMSPQKDWFQNVSMAERAIDILTNYGDSTWTPKMLQYAESYINEAEDRADREGRQIFFDKRIKKMNDNQVKLKDMGIKEAAAFVRAYDEAFHDRKYNIVTPEGGFGGTVMNKNPDPDTGLFKPATMMWSTYSPIEKTVSIFREPTRKNISEKLGEEHKIRSFYNNIIAPNSPIGHVTIDTHAVAAALYESLAGTDPEVTHNFGGTGKNTKIGVGGTYGIIADAYREAAAKVGLKPREMQSVTWEAVRGMFPENIKSQIKQKVRDEWTKYRTGEQTFEKARSNIEAIGDRADSPDWVNSDEGTFVEDGGSSFDASFTPEGGVRLRKANEIKEKATVNLSAVTGTIPGLQELHTRALNGDASAYETLQKVATSTLRFLLSGTKAKISFQPIKGVYEEGREPAIMAQVNFRESESKQVLAALSKFGRNFNQEAIHVRTKTKYKAGHNFDDGSYATPVYTIPLKNELTEKDIVDIVNTSGLKGFSVSKTELIAYHVQGKYNDISEYDSFLDIVRGVHETYGATDKRLQQGVQRLAVYGDGYGARTSYQDIASDLQTKQLADRETPRIIAEYLNQHPIKPFEQKPLTKAQKVEQTVLKDIYQVLPVNDLKKPIVRKAYAALAQEVKRQYETLPIKVQLTVARKDADGNYIDIYKNSAEVRKDVSLNNRFKVLKTEPNTFGPEGTDFSGHPLLANSGLTDVSGKPMLYNDLLRAVHDYFAHNLSDTEFGPKGEFAAWKNHMATTKDPLARWALTQETRAQNAWQNFRPEAKTLTLKERGFADQKAALPPATFALTGDLNVDASMIKFIEGLDGNQRLGSLSPRSPLVSQIPTLPQAEKLSLRTDVAEDIRNMPNGAAIEAAINRTTATRQEVGFVERMTAALAPESFSYFRQKALDRYNRLNDVEKLIATQMGGIKRLADQNAHAAALQSDAAAGVAASALGVGNRMGGMPVYRNGYTTVSNENGTVKGAVEIFSPLAKYGDPKIYQAYQFWAGAKRGKRLMASGKEELYTPQDMALAKQLEEKYPEFVSVQKDWIQYNNGLVKYAVDTGVISAQNAEEFTRYSDYVPFYRQLEGERTVGPNIFQSISGVKAPKKITGSEAPLADFLETVVRNTQSIIQAGMKNVAAQKAVNGGMMVGMVRKMDHVASGPNSITILENGQKVSYECADKLWVDAVSSLNLPELPFLNFLAAPANFLRAAVTKDPGFMLANLMRDSVSAYVTSGAKLTPVASAVKEMTSVLMNNSPEYQKLLSAGVLGGYEFSRNVEASAEAFAKDLRKKTGTKTGFESATSPFTFFWDALEKGTEASDAATRIAVYKATLAETGNEAEAIHRALEVMNFNRKGSSVIIRVAAATIPFLNARVQGLDVFFRAGIRPFMDANATEQEKQVQKAMIIRGMTILGLSVMYAMAVSGNPDYENQEEETKDNNWIIPMGEGKIPLKIPIPFEVGTLFKTIPERIYRSFFMADEENRDTTEDLHKSMKRALLSTFGFNPVPQIAAPLLEARDNYSVFTQRPIVGQNMQGIAPEFQVGPGTSKWAEILGQQAGMSPMMIDHVFKGYTGTMGVYAADLLDAAIGAISPSEVEKPSKRIEQMPIIKRFLADPEARGKITSYFDLKHSVDTAVRTMNKLEKEGNENIEGYVDKNAELIAARDFMKSLNKQMDELQQQANMIRSAEMPADEKRDMLSEITKAQNLLVADIRSIRNLVKP